MQGIWDAFDVQTGLDIVISIHQADGVRRLTLSDWLRPETLQAINDLIVRAAFDLGLEDGKKLRVDTTVSETDILCTAVHKMSLSTTVVSLRTLRPLATRFCRATATTRR